MWAKNRLLSHRKFADRRKSKALVSLLVSGQASATEMDRERLSVRRIIDRCNKDLEEGERRMDVERYSDDYERLISLSHLTGAASTSHRLFH